MLPKFSRKDKSAFTKNTYVKIMNMILDKCTLDEALNALILEVQKLLDGQVPRHDLIINRTLSSNYKTETFPLKVFADKVGNINLGDTVSYVIVQDSSQLQSHKMRLPDTQEAIDYNYYIEKELMGYINDLFKTGFANEMTGSHRLSYNNENRLITCV